MPPFDIKQFKNENGERLIRLANGQCIIEAPLDYGPRIMKYGLREDHNVFACLNLIEKNGWNLRGGHRLWHSPESYPRTYIPDNQPVELAVKESGFVLTQAKEEWTNIVKSIEVKMDPNSARICLTHELYNSGPWDISLSAWPITAMAPGGLEIIPLNNCDTGLLPNQSIVLWPGTSVNDTRLKWLEKYLLIKHDGSKGSMKLGFNNRNGFAAYYKQESLFTKKYQLDEGEYPDCGSSYETYLCPEMLEMETLSPVKRLKPGDSIRHMEEWNLLSLKLSLDDLGDEKKIEEIFRNNLIGDDKR